MVPTILLSGGSGRLGAELQSLEPGIAAPDTSEMDVTKRESVSSAIEKYSPKIFLHAAAFTSPPRVDADPLAAVDVNIVGTANVVAACMAKNVRLVYISTDYVFKGDRGTYAEEDELLPQNKYAWSKLGGECAVRLYDNALIIRTSFCPVPFPYDKAFVDQYTSRDSVKVIAPLILEAARYMDVTGVMHIGTRRKTVYDLATSLGAKVAKLLRSEVPFKAPADTSFDTSRFEAEQKRHANNMNP